MMKRCFWVLGTALVSACASYSGSGLQPGTATLQDVIQIMGQPAMRWQEADGALQLSYPKGPSSPESFMVRLDKQSRLVSINNVLVPEITEKIVSGMTKEEVLRLIGPPIAARTVYFTARNELVWDWRYEEKRGDLAHFSVVFDATEGRVRTTLVIPDAKAGMPF